MSPLLQMILGGLATKAFNKTETGQQLDEGVNSLLDYLKNNILGGDSEPQEGLLSTNQSFIPQEQQDLGGFTRTADGTTNVIPAMPMVTERKVVDYNAPTTQSPVMNLSNQDSMTPEQVNKYSNMSDTVGNYDTTLEDIMNKNLNSTSPAADAFSRGSQEMNLAKEEPSLLDKMGQGVNDFNSGLKETVSDLGSGIGDFFNEERMARMTIALNSMRLNPDPNIAKSMELKLDRLQKNKGSTKTAQALRAMGREDLAKMVESGQIDAKTAITIAYKKGSAFEEKLEFIEGKTPEELARYKDLGILGGGTTINMGNDKYYDAIGKDIATMQSTHRERGELATSSLNALNELNTAIVNFGETGPDEYTKQKLRVMASKYGMGSLIDESKMSNGQYVEAIKNRMVAEELRRNKGPQTDFDAKFAGTYIPGLGTSTEANKALMNYSKSISLQQTIFSNMSASIRLSDFDNAQNTIREIDQLSLMSPGAMERNDGTWITFNEFFNSDLEQIKSMSAQERLQEWSNRYKQRMGFK